MMAAVAATCSAPKDIVLLPVTPAPVVAQDPGGPLQLTSPGAAPSTLDGIVSLSPPGISCPPDEDKADAATPVTAAAAEGAEAAAGCR
jgi:hypothetical protein